MMNDDEKKSTRKMRQNERRAKRNAAKKERIKKAIAEQVSLTGHPLKRSELAADRSLVNTLAKRFNLKG